MNLVILKGRLGKDPELRTTTTGVSVCDVSLATDSYGDADPEWHKLTFWKKTAETVARHCRKGSEILVRGSVKTESWEDSEGNKRYTTKINVWEFEFCGPKADSARPAATSDAPASRQTEVPDDELPF